jgi:hypothetical protein
MTLMDCVVHYEESHAKHKSLPHKQVSPFADKLLDYEMWDLIIAQGAKPKCGPPALACQRELTIQMVIPTIVLLYRRQAEFIDSFGF